MNPFENFELKRDEFIRQNFERGGLFFTKHYLLLEVERLEITLQHFYQAGAVIRDDYEYLLITLKMIKKFLNIHLRTHNPHPKNRSKHKYAYINPRQASLFDHSNPLPITGKIEVSGLNESLSALKPIQNVEAVPKFPFKIPAGTQWSNIIIKFLDDECIEILVRKLRYTATYKEMGMIGKGKTPEPSEQWIFLKVLAQCYGELSIKDSEAKDKYKKHKQGLSETLRNYFSIDYDPFYPYQSSVEKSGNSYKIKITLLPPPENSVKSKQDFDNSDKLGIDEYLNETAPLI